MIDAAIVGATGEIGHAIIKILEERKFPVNNLHLLASERSIGKKILFKNKEISVENLATFDFSKVKIAFFSAGGKVSAKYAPIAATQGALVIDNTSHFRQEEDIPLIVPEVNPDDLSLYKKHRIIANPNCSTIQMVVALKPIHDKYKIEHIDVSTYQSVSGAGHSAIIELINQTKSTLDNKPVETNIFPQSMAFNVLPHIDVFQENLFTKEEMKMNWETKKILDNNIEVNATCVRVPVLYGHSEAVHIKTKKKIDIKEVYTLLKKADGVTILGEEPQEYPTAAKNAQYKDDTFVGRIRHSLVYNEYGLNMWLVSDNIRKGGALNSIQIAELVIQKYNNDF